MVVLKTKTKFTKSKFTKNNYSTKKKNVSRMTKKMNVMKGGMKPLNSGIMKPLNSKSRSRSGSGSMSNFPSHYLNIARKPNFNNNFSKQYFLGEGNKYNRGSRFARINVSQLKKSLTNNTKTLETKKKIIFNTLRGKYELDFVKYAMNNPDKFTNLLENSNTFKKKSGIYVNMSPQTNKPVYNTLNSGRANRPLPPTPGYSSLSKPPTYENPYATIS